MWKFVNYQEWDGVAKGEETDLAGSTESTIHDGIRDRSLGMLLKDGL